MTTHRLGEDCPKNLRHLGHCMHTQTHATDAGTFITSRCCWCDKPGPTQQISVPEHGKYAPK